MQYDSIESLSVYGSVEGVSSIYVNSHQYVLPIPKPLTPGDVWHNKVKSSYDKRIVLDGTESWKLSGAGVTYLITVTDIAAGDHIASSYLKAYENDELYKKKVGIAASSRSGTIRVYLPDNANPSEYFETKPLTVYYQSTAYDGTNGLTVSVADYQGEIYANDFVDIFTDDGELWVDGGDFAEVAVSNIVLNGKTNDERAGEYGTPQVHTFP